MSSLQLCFDDDSFASQKLWEETISGSLLLSHLGANPPLTLIPCLFPFWCMGVHQELLSCCLGKQWLL